MRGSAQELCAPRTGQDVRGDESELGVLNTCANWLDHPSAGEQVNGSLDRGGQQTEAAVYDQSKAREPFFVEQCALHQDRTGSPHGRIEYKCEIA